MRKVHFYKARTRLGIINPLIHQKDLNVGVEDAPDAILTKEFLLNFDNPQVSEFTFSKPEDIDKTKYFGVLSSELSEFKDLINKTLGTRETQVIIGGDNSITFSSLLAVLERVGDPNKVGYIQFDSHGEVNMYKTSLSKNFHGMYIRPFLDSFDVAKIKSLINLKLKTSNILFIGNLELDREEKIYFEKSKFKNINKEDLTKNRNKVLKELEDFVKTFEYLHINFDIDVFSSKEVLATGIPGVEGFMMDEVSDLLKIVSSHPKLSLDLAEVNPSKKGGRKTISVAQKVLETFLNH